MRGGRRRGAGRRRRVWGGPPSSLNDGLVLEIVEKNGGADLSDVLVALKKHKPAWNRLKKKGLLTKSENYLRPDRMARDPMPKSGDRTKRPKGPPFGPGYKGRGHLRGLNKSLKLLSNRPFHPAWTEKTIDGLVEELLNHYLGTTSDV